MANDMVGQLNELMDGDHSIFMHREIKHVAGWKIHTLDLGTVGSLLGAEAEFSSAELYVPSVTI